jgi:branched-chain amino acid aminotransferase
MNQSLDRGLLLGDGLFETVLLRNGRPFRLGRHLARLEEGASRVGIPVPDDLEGRIDETLRRARRRVDTPASEDAPRWEALRITLTRGPGDGLIPPEDPAPGLYLRVRTIRRAPPAERPGISAVTAGRVDERALSNALKSTGYLERILAHREARRQGADEAILLNSRDRMVEGSASNLFRVREGVLYTPGCREGALPGVTRAVLLELAASMGIPLGEGPAAPTPEEAYTDCELFLSSSIRGPIALVRLDGTPIGPTEREGRPGPVFSRLAEALERLIESESG